MRPVSMPLLLALVVAPALADELPRLSISDAVVAEAGGRAVFVLELLDAISSPLTVEWATADLTATGGADYAAAAGHLTFFPGGEQVAAVHVPIHDDELAEPAEGFFVHLSAAGATVVKASGHGAIRDDDGYVTSAARCDLDGEGRSDLVVGRYEVDPLTLRHVDKHEPWGTTVTVAQPMRAVSSEGWDVVATHDFDGDGGCDLAWLGADHELAVTGSRVGSPLREPTSDDVVVAATPRGWEVVGSGRFGPGAADLLWWDAETKTLEVWESVREDDRVGFPVELRRSFAGEPDPAWQPAVAADLDGDGAPELLWQHSLSGQLRTWRRAWKDPDEEVTVGAIDPLGPTHPTWHLVASGDFDGDGFEDLLFQREQTLKLVVWFLRDGRRTAGSFLSPDRFGPPEPEAGEAPLHGERWAIRGPR